jgi:hypothetical protein
MGNKVPFGIVRTASTYLITRKKHQISENIKKLDMKATNILTCYFSQAA